MRLITTVLQTIALASAARSATANLRGDRGDRGTGTGEQRGKPEVEADSGKTVIVQIKKDNRAKGRGDALAEDCAAVAAAAGGTVAAVYDRVLHGCAVRLAAGRAGASAAAMNANPRVIGLEEDQVVHADYSWGLDRVDQCDLPLGGTGTLTKVDATGVRVYVVDTGINKDHAEFANMIDAASACHINTVGDGEGPFDDGNGHG